MNAFDGEVKVVGPGNDVEIFLSGFESIYYSVEQHLIVFESAIEKAKILMIEVFPKTPAVQMFK